MKKMKAIVKQSAKATDFALTEVPIPEIDENEMLIQVQAIGVGIHDGYFLPATIQYPYTIGIEASGIIEKIGGNVTDYQTGDQIAFVSMMQPKGGTWAEYAVVKDNSLIIPLPKGMSFTEAAAVPVAGNTALKAFHALQLQSNDTLFIAGSSGAIGTFAIQIANAQGCIVAGSASEKNHAYMQSLGADKTVDYHDSDWTKQIRQWMPSGVDAALAIQPGTGITSMDVVKDGGRIVAVSGDQFQPERNITVEQIPHHVNIKNDLVHLMNKIASNEMKLFIERTYHFEEALEALQKTNTRHSRGKLVITME